MSLDVEMVSSGSRKRIGETCKKKALSLAKRAISPKGFLVVMKRSHVVSKCYLVNCTVFFKISFAAFQLLGLQKCMLIISLFFSSQQ